jgi:Zn-dependent membrane protease YugP
MNLHAFADELAAMQKEAAKQDEKDEREARNLAGAAIAAAGMLGGAGMLGLKEALHSSLDRAPRVALGSIDDLAAKMGIEAPLRAVDNKRFYYVYPDSIKGKLLQEMVRHGVPKSEIDHARRAGVVAGPAVWRQGVDAHEVGHAVNYSKNKILTALSRTSRTIGKAPLVAGAMVGGLMVAAPEDAESWAVKAAPAMPILFHAPVLADEALASVRAFKGMKGLGTYSAKTLKQAKGNLVKAFGTYLLQAAAVSAPVAALSIGRVMQSKKEKKASAAVYRRMMPSLFARAYKEDEDFRNTVKRTLSTDPNTRRNW